VKKRICNKTVRRAFHQKEGNVRIERSSFRRFQQGRGGGIFKRKNGVKASRKADAFVVGKGGNLTSGAAGEGVREASEEGGSNSKRKGGTGLENRTLHVHQFL